MEFRSSHGGSILSADIIKILREIVSWSLQVGRQLIFNNQCNCFVGQLVLSLNFKTFDVVPYFTLFYRSIDTLKRKKLGLKSDLFARKNLDFRIRSSSSSSSSFFGVGEGFSSKMEEEVIKRISKHIFSASSVWKLLL